MGGGRGIEISTEKVGILLEAQFNSLINSLNKLNKEIDPSEKAQIFKMIEHIKKNEGYLSKTLNYIYNYIQLYNSIPQNNDKYVKLETVVELVNKYKNKVDKLQPKRIGVVSIIDKLTQILADYNNTTTNPSGTKSSTTKFDINALGL